MIKDEFITEIDTYCRASGMAVTPFGRAAVGDPGFVARLKAGGDVTLSTVEKVHNFMKDNPPTGAVPIPVAAEKDAAA